MSFDQVPAATQKFVKLFRLVCTKPLDDGARDVLDKVVNDRLQEVLRERDWDGRTRISLMSEFAEMATRIDCASETGVGTDTIKQTADYVKEKYKSHAPASGDSLGCDDIELVEAEFFATFDLACDKPFHNICPTLDEVFQKTVCNAMCGDDQKMWDDEARLYVLPKVAELATRIEMKLGGTASAAIAKSVAHKLIMKYWNRYRKKAVVEWCKGWEKDLPCPPALDRRRPAM